MKSQFSHIGIVTRPNTPDIGVVLNRLIGFLQGLECEVYLEDNLDPAVCQNGVAANCARLPQGQLGKKCNLIIVLGGDGTFLSAARQAAPFRVPLLGINQGHLGFLAQVAQEKMEAELRGMLNGKYLTDECILLETWVTRNGEELHHSLALNDVVLSRGGAGQMIGFEIFINGQFVYTQRSDGLIVSTPTGSTAYALAAGGPILQNALRAFTIVPICPQSLTNRPIVVSDTSEIKILVTRSGDARVHYDGQSFADIQSMDTITIRRYRNPVRVLHPTDYTYYKTLRQKLHWGEQLI